MTSTGSTSCCVSHATKIFLIVSLELYGVSSYDVTAVGSQWGAWQTANSQREPGERLEIEVCQALTVMTSRVREDKASVLSFRGLPARQLTRLGDVQPRLLLHLLILTAWLLLASSLP